jgi:AbrB family looped-hinge helix DNA binding protein
MLNMTTLTMSENGRVLIPAALREELGFKSNTRIFIEVRDGSLVLTSPAQHYARLRTYFDQHLTPHTPKIHGQDSVDEFIAERRTEAAREDKQ